MVVCCERFHAHNTQYGLVAWLSSLRFPTIRAWTQLVIRMGGLD